MKLFFAAFLMRFLSNVLIMLQQLLETAIREMHLRGVQ